jgi:hypothetical protein
MNGAILEDKNLKRSKRTILVLHFFIWGAVAMFLSWASRRPPMFEGIAGVMVICYFVGLMGVLVTSFYWLARFDKKPASENISRNTRTFVVASLIISTIISTIVMVGSLFFVLFALAVRGLFNML